MGSFRDGRKAFVSRNGSGLVVGWIDHAQRHNLGFLAALVQLVVVQTKVPFAVPHQPCWFHGQTKLKRCLESSSFHTLGDTLCALSVGVFESEIQIVVACVVTESGLNHVYELSRSNFIPVTERSFMPTTATHPPHFCSFSNFGLLLPNHFVASEPMFIALQNNRIFTNNLLQPYSSLP